MENIITTFDPKPIPIRCFDWEATFPDYDGGGPIGFGATEADAIEDLKEMAEEIYGEL